MSQGGGGEETAEALGVRDLAVTPRLRYTRQDPVLSKRMADGTQSAAECYEPLMSGRER